MSYILEALKKAQAERALGSAPSVHATPLHPVEAPAHRAGNASLWIGLAVGLVVAAAAWLVWRTSDHAPAPPTAPQQAAPQTPAQQDAAPMALPQAAQQPMAAQAVVQAPANPAPASSPAPTPAPAPLRLAPMPAIAGKPANAPEARVVAKPAPMQAAAAPAAAAAVAAAPAPALAPEESLPTLRGLPEAIAREVPTVTIGGYVYSNNPADRLLLVDKVLRHEGEELAPGLILEKLLPKAAVMNYKGYRYRVAY